MFPEKFCRDPVRQYFHRRSNEPDVVVEKQTRFASNKTAPDAQSLTCWKNCYAYVYHYGFATHHVMGRNVDSRRMQQNRMGGDL